MSPPANVVIQALVGEGERPIVTKAVELLQSGLNEVGKRPWTTSLTFPDAVGALDGVHDAAVVVVSLLDELDRLDEPWIDVEARLRSKFGKLCESPRWSVFACTVLRHVVGDEHGADPAELKVRIRRLNLLVAELSRELGLFVVDIDRDLADVGARALDTDCRLQGPYAALVAGKSMAMALLLVGLDEFVPFEIQEAAREVVRAVPVETAREAVFKPRMIGRPVVFVRTGKRRQVVEATMDPVDENFVASHINRLLKRQISLAEALALLMGAVSRRGWRVSCNRLLAGFGKVVSNNRLIKR